MRVLLVAVCVLGACGDNSPHDGTFPIPAVEVPASVRVVEGDSATFLVKLAEDPQRDLVIDVVSLDGATASVVTAQITLTSENFANGELVTVLGTEDDDDLVNDTTDIELTIAGELQASVVATVFDNDTQQIVLDTASLTLAEAATGTFTARLTREPGAPVTAKVWSSKVLVATASPATLMFDASNFATPQTVTVTAVADADTADDAAEIHIGDVPSATAQAVEIDVTDDDVQAFVLGAATVPVAEGDSATFTVALAFDPLGAVNVNLASSDASVVPAPLSLAFDSANYNIPQIVTLTGAEDVNTTNEMATVTLSGPLAGDVTVPVTDNDDILVASAQVTVPEGRIATFPVRLANDPGANGRTVTVEVLSGDALVVQSTLAFTSADYATMQDVPVYGIVDPASTSDKSAVVRVSSPGQEPRDVAITVQHRPGAGLFPALTIQRQSANASEQGWMELQLTIDSIWPGDGKLVVGLPPGYDASSATLVSSSVDGTLALAATASSITLTRSNGTPVFSPTVVTVRVDGVRNPMIVADYSIAVATQAASGGTLDSGSAAAAVASGLLTNASVTLSSVQPDATAAATIAFTTANLWPADGKLEIYFPSEDFDIAALTLASKTGVDGTFSVAKIGEGQVELVRSGGTALPAGSPVSIVLGNLSNPAVPQATTFFELETTNATGHRIDVAFPKGVTIGCPATMTKRPHNAHNAPFGGDPWTDPLGATELHGPGGASIAQVEASDYLVVDDFQFTVPAGATIAGIRFDVERESSVWPAIDSAVRVVTSTIGATDRASATPWLASQTAAYGGATDLWGETWTAAAIESSTFGLALAAKAVTSGMTPSVTVRSVTATVYLTCP